MVDREQIAECLRSEQAQIAQLAGRELLPRVMAMMEAQRSEAGEAGLPGSEEAMLALVEDGFRRLGAVVSLSVLVDEPKLVADDLQWLRGMLGMRVREMASNEWVEALTQGYGAACASCLDPESAAVVASTLDRALRVLEGEEGAERRRSH